MRKLLAAAVMAVGVTVGAPVAGAAVSIVLNHAEKVTFRNSDADWTIYKKCIPDTDPRGAVGPGYVARVRLNKAYGPYGSGRLVANDQIPNVPEDQQVGKFRGGIGGFAFSHARGGDGRNPSLELAPAQSVYQDIGTRSCFPNRGVHAVTTDLAPTVGTDGVGRVQYTVYLRDEKGATFYGPDQQALASVTYDTYVYDNRMRQKISVQFAAVELAWDPTYRYAFIKEVGFRFSTRGGDVNYKGMSAYSSDQSSTAEPRIGGLYGSATQGSKHFGQTYRGRVRFDWTDAAGTLLACEDNLRPCLNVRAWGGTSDYWGGGGMDLLARDLDAAMPWAATDQLNSNAGNGFTDRRWDCDGADPVDHMNSTRARLSDPKYGPPPAGAFDVPNDGTLIDDGADEVSPFRDNIHWTTNPASPGDANARQWEYFNSDGSHPAIAMPSWLGGRGGFDCEPLTVNAAPVTGRVYVNWTTYWINTM